MMFRILVADDEKVIRRGIIAILQRGLKKEIEYIEASNGLEALNITKQHHVNLVITDICMPLCNGLEFVSKLKKNREDMTVIVLSGYENFEYAKQAIKLGIKDYVMKPVNKPEFLGIIENCIAVIENKQIASMQAFKKRVENDEIIGNVKMESLIQLLKNQDIKKYLDKLKMFGISFQSSLYVCAVIEYKRNTNNEGYVDFAVENILDEYLKEHGIERTIMVKYSAGCLAIIFGGMDQQKIHKNKRMLAEAVALVRKICNMQAVVGIGDMVYELKDLHRSFKDALEAADFKIYDTKELLFLYDELKQGRQYESLKLEHITENLDMQSEIGVLNIFEILFKEPKSKNAMDMIRKSYNELLEIAEDKLKNINNNNQEQIVNFQKFQNFWSFFELRREIQSIVKYVNSMLDEYGEINNSRLIQEIINYIICHATEDIDLNFLAEKFSKTPGYISTLFKQGSNIGFNEFITKERIKIAKNLLKDEAVSIQQVGKLCGYYNPKYFSVVFKKVTGMSPKIYRERKRLNNS